MLQFMYFCLFFCVSGLSSDEIKTTLLSDDNVEEINCEGEEYSYLNGKCYCALEYVPNRSNTKCIKCPGLGDSCDGSCCSSTSENHNTNKTLQCWHGVCQQCHNANGDWICRENLKDCLPPRSEIALGIILIFGLVGVSLLLYKICTIVNSWVLRFRSNDQQRPSVGSLEQVVEARLRDAPPRYSTTAPIVPVTIYLIEGFVHDSSVPPPPYTTEDKKEEERNTTLHI